jgi:hypothetical protein
MNTPFGMPPFDPSKMDPKVMMELSQLIQSLPPNQLQKMQTIMHNAMAGFDVRREMEEFERSLPPGFREKLMGLMGGQMGAFGGMGPTGSAEPAKSIPGAHEASDSASAMEPHEMNLHQARITILRAVADGRMSPEEAEKLLFPT